MKIALIGNQNSGKTTLFNTLTGTNQKIGNWPGVTVEKKIGLIKDLNAEIIDLPGIYSLSPYTVEEEVSRKYILEEKPDLIINIVDSTSLERSLYLTTQVLELNIKVIVVLNMIDKLEAKGIFIDEQKLSREIGVDVIKISASKNIGIEELKNKIKNYRKQTIKSKEIFKSNIENEIINIEKILKCNRFEAIKILENDKNYMKYQTEKIRNIRQNIEEIYKMDIEEIIANERYNYIANIKNKVISIKKVKDTNVRELDKIFLNKYLAIPIFIIIMFLIYYLSVGVVGKICTDWILNTIKQFGENIRIFLNSLGASCWSQSLVVDGIISGVGCVLSFIPQLTILFLCISFLETTAYMARVTFLLDKIFRKFGLCGESLIPFIVGLRMQCSRNNGIKNNKR